MIPVTVNGAKYALEFSHTPYTPPTKKRAISTFAGEQLVVERLVRSRRSTLCRLLKMHDEQNGAVVSFTEVARGEARCSLSDNFCRDTGREVALKQALVNARKSHDPNFTAYSADTAWLVMQNEDQVWEHYDRRGVLPRLQKAV